MIPRLRLLTRNKEIMAKPINIFDGMRCEVAACGRVSWDRLSAVVAEMEAGALRKIAAFR